MPPKKNARAQGKVSVKESNPKEAEKDKVEKHNDGTPAVARAVDGMAGDAAPKLLSQKHRHKAGSPSPVRNVVSGATGAVPQPPPPANSVPKKDRLERCHLVQKELIDKLDDPFFKAKNVKDIPESVQSLYTDAVLDTLLGVTRCAACGCTIAQHRETADTALEILRKAEEGGRATALDWVFSYPQLPPPQNLAGIRASFDKADKAIQRTIQGELTINADSRGDLLFAVQAGIGIGKSFSIDMASQLLFVDQDPLVLKVTYNKNQKFSLTEKQNRDDGLLARLAIPVKMTVPPVDCDLVGRMLSCQEPLTPETLADYIDEHRQGRPVILAVDEIGCIAKGSTPLGEMLSSLTQVMLQLLRKRVPCRGIVTALPSVDTTSESGRGLKFVRPPILTPEHSMSLLKSVLGGRRSEEYGEAELKRVLSLCNGHPRSLVIAGQLMSGQTKVSVAANLVANECKWKADQGPTAHQIVNFLSEQYLGKSQRTEAGTPKSKIAVALYKKNLLFTSGDGSDDVIPPIILFVPTDLKDGLRFAKAMFCNNPDQNPSKNLEDVHMNWDYFRCQYRFPVVPPTMSVLGTPIEKKIYFMFKPDKATETCDVVATSGKEKRVAIAKICEETYYKPSNTSHFAFESMCVGRIDGSKGNKGRILILFQSKINDDFNTAYTNLRSAAALLRKGSKPAWKGRILFVILACGTSSSSVTVNEEDSVLLVGRKEMHLYFTRSLVPAVELLVEGHQSTKKWARK